MTTGVPLELLPPITAELRRVIGVAARLAPLTVKQQAAFDFLYRWLRHSLDIGRLTFTDFRVQRARTRYLHAATNRSNAA